MSEGSSSSASNSGTPPANAAHNTHDPLGDKPGGKHPLSESEFLRQQAEEARRAFSATLSQLGAELGHSADPRAWAKAHPWLSVSGAAVAGFATMVAVVPTREQQALKHLAAIERAIAPKQPAVVASNDDGANHKEAARGGIGHKLIEELFKSLRPIVMSALSAGLAARMGNQQEDPNEDPGDPSEAAAAATQETGE